MKAWENFLLRQETELGKSVVAKWLQPLKILKFDACNLYLEAKDSFHAIWFEEHMRDKVQVELYNNNNRRIKVHVAVTGKKGTRPPSKRKETSNPSERKEALPVLVMHCDDLDPFCTLDQLVTSSGNNLAFKVICEATGYDPKTKTYDSSKRALGNFNPIFVQGPSGSGKTHMLMATAHALKEQGLSVMYTRAESFTRHVVAAIRAGAMPTFRDAYRKSDVLIIDDVDVFSGKRATQEELFHTFNTLHVNGQQIILSSKLVPQELEAIEPRLVSRFEWGIVVPVEAPGDKELAAILINKSRILGIPLSEKVSQFMLEAFSRNATSLMRALEALVLRCHMNFDEDRLSKIPITQSLVKEYLADLLEEEQKVLITPDKIIQTVAEYYGITYEDVARSKGQTRDIVVPRQVAMYLCREQLALPYMKLGKIFTRDHSTVMSAIKQVDKAIEGGDEDLVAVVATIKKKLQN